MVQKKYSRTWNFFRLMRILAIKKRYRILRRTGMQIEVFDTTTSIAELVRETGMNFLWGFGSNIVTPFIVAHKDLMIVFCYGMNAIIVSNIINREKYTTRLGKFIVLPVPLAIGGMTAYFLGNYLVTFFH